MGFCFSGVALILNVTSRLRQSSGIVAHLGNFRLADSGVSKASYDANSLKEGLVQVLACCRGDVCQFSSLVEPVAATYTSIDEFGTHQCTNWSSLGAPFSSLPELKPALYKHRGTISVHTKSSTPLRQHKTQSFQSLCSVTQLILEA